eukprot:GCRY01000095.1.p1 GENE.GCRY01000095.1~~GCRY01000095.1.p1  ORF type:complete len:245 (+),score=29.26 GCRY01000095.1:103-735(+)
MRSLIVTFALLCCFAASFATTGVDVSTSVEPHQFQCMKEHGIHFAIVRAFCSSGRVDEHGVHTVANAWRGNMSHVDIYMFPCPHCGDAARQVDEMIHHMGTVKYGMVWLDIEGSQYWKTKSYNREFLQHLITRVKHHGKKVGIYASYYQWESIMGLDYHGAKEYPLWYAHYDGRQTFRDFTSFGGWSHPSIKQYHGTASLCGAGVDYDWY